MKTIEIIRSPEIKEITERYRELQKGKEQNAWNIFNLSSYNNQLENFHSDIIASILDPQGLHGESDKFLMLFIDYLNKHHQCDIARENFRHSWVPREKGRIDIGIFNQESNSCIIIENKINNAGDQDLQIERYVDYALQKKYNVIAVVYLSLDGLKKAPTTKESINHLIKNIPAFENQENDLVNGWLMHCERNCENNDSRSLINQYSKLIKQIAHISMDNQINEDFYTLIANPEYFEATRNIETLLNNLPTFRRDKFQKSIKEIAPFKIMPKFTGIENRVTLMNGFMVDNMNMQLDAYFSKEGSVFVHFWCYSSPDNEGLGKAIEILSRIKLINDFKSEQKGIRLQKRFGIEDYGDLITLDKSVLSYVEQLLALLRTTYSQPE